MAESFFVSDGDRYLPTELTRGPRDPRAQHAGPPAALLGWAAERHGGRAELRVARATFEILRPVLIAPLELTTVYLQRPPATLCRAGPAAATLRRPAKASLAPTSRGGGCSGWGPTEARAFGRHRRGRAAQ